MSWFKKKMKNWLFSDDKCYSVGISNSLRRMENSSTSFKVCKADKGFVVETNFWDRKKDEYQSNLYIVLDDDDLGQEIGKILTMETLKHG